MAKYRYLNNHKDSVIKYNEREGIKVPESVDGIVYKQPGIQENTNCSLVTMRMKRRKMRWSIKGAGN